MMYCLIVIGMSTDVCLHVDHSLSPTYTSSEQWWLSRG